jgi:WD40 repeat protein
MSSDRPGRLGALIGLHIVTGCVLVALGIQWRLPGGFPFLVVGAWYAGIGVGLLLWKPWAWWSAAIGHPILLLLEAATIVAAAFGVKEGFESEGFGQLAGVVAAIVGVAALGAFVVTLATWLYLLKPEVREAFFDEAFSRTTGLGVAIAILAVAAVAPFLWERATRAPRPPGYPRAAPRRVSRPNGAPASAAAPEPCSSRYPSQLNLAFSPDGSRLVGGQARVTCVWEASTGKLEAVVTPEGSATPGAMAVSPDGRLLAMVEHERYSARITLRDLGTGRPASAVSVPVDSPYQGVFVGFGPAAGTLLGQTGPQTIGAFDTASGAARSSWTVEGKTRLGVVALSPTRRRIAMAGSGSVSVLLAEVETGESRTFAPGPAPGSVLKGSQPIQSILFSPDESTLYLGRLDSIAVVDLSNGRERPPLVFPGTPYWNPTPLAVTAGGTRLLARAGNRLFPIFHLPDGELITLGAAHQSRSEQTVPIFVEGRLGGSFGWGRVVGANGHPVSVALLPHLNESVGRPGSGSGPAQTWGSAVSPDGSLLVLVIDALSNLTLWNASTDAWVDLLSPYGSYGPGVRLAFSPDGRRLAASGNHGLDLWDVPARKRLYRIGGPDHD